MKNHPVHPTKPRPIPTPPGVGGRLISVIMRLHEKRDARPAVAPEPAPVAKKRKARARV